MDTWLAVEDDGEEVFFLKRAFEQAAIPIRVEFVTDGEQAIAYLEGEGQFIDRKTHPFPRVLLLDLKMPKVDGFEVLRWRQERHLNLPALILTSSTSEEDVRHAYQLGASSYLIKPSDPDRMGELVRAVSDYWHRLNEFPPIETFFSRHSQSGEQPGISDQQRRT